MSINTKILPSCLQTTFPQDKQLLIRSCLVAWQLQLWRPSRLKKFCAVSIFCEVTFLLFLGFIGWVLFRGISSLNWQSPLWLGIFPVVLIERKHSPLWKNMKVSNSFNPANLQDYNYYLRNSLPSKPTSFLSCDVSCCLFWFVVLVEFFCPPTFFLVGAEK